MALAAPLLYAGVSKVLGPEYFAAALAQYELGSRGSRALARAVGAVELGVGAGLVLVATAASSALAAALYAAFATLTLRAYRRGARGDCGCFGAARTTIDGWAVLRSVVLMLGSIALAYGRSVHAVGGYEVRAAVLTVTGAVVVGATVDTLIALRRPT